MAATPVRCLVLACGNTLRSDDGVGPWLADWVEARFAAEPAVRVIARQQWTPDLAEDIAQAASVLFIDCAVDASPGALRFHPVHPARPESGLATHHTGASELLALTRELCGFQPADAQLLTIGAGSIQMGESFSAGVQSALPDACRKLEREIVRILASGSARKDIPLPS